MNGHVNTRLRQSPRRGFTLAELLVVIAILALLLLVAIPSFSAILKSQDRSQAEIQLRVGLTAARDAAVRSDAFLNAADTAAVFFYDPDGGCRIVACVKVGELDDVGPNPSDPSNPIVRREVFVPVPNIRPAQLPRGFMVRGYAPTVNFPPTAEQWYESDTVLRNEGNWVFPETAFFNASQGNAGAERQTFMIRFEAGTGNLAIAGRGEALVLSPSPSLAFRTQTPWNRPEFRLDEADDQAAMARRMLGERTDLSLNDLRRMLGDEASDTVLARPVTELAMYEERRLASAIGARGVNLATGCLYAEANVPEYDGALFGGSANGPEIAEKINNWLVGKLEADGEPVESDARLYAVERYQGLAQEITP